MRILDALLARLRPLAGRASVVRLAYGAFFALALLVALRQTFPVQALKERLILEASARGWQVDAAEVGPAGLVGMRAREVVLEDRAGLRLSAEELSVSLRLLPLLVGRRSVAFDVRLWDGRIRGTADLGEGERRLSATVEGMDLASAAPIRQALRLELLGVVAGTADLTLPADPAGKPTGRVELRVADAGLNGGQVPIPGMTQPLTIPRVGLGRVDARIQLADGKGTFERLEARDGDAELAADGLYFVPQPRLASSPLYGRLGVRIGDAFLDRPGNSAFKGLLELGLRGARGKDGFYQLQLYGTLAGPQARPIATGAAPPPPPVGPPRGRPGPGSPAPE